MDVGGSGMMAKTLATALATGCRRVRNKLLSTLRRIIMPIFIENNLVRQVAEASNEPNTAGTEARVQNQSATPEQTPYSVWFDMTCSLG